jgi:hypothetical protein
MTEAAMTHEQVEELKKQHSAALEAAKVQLTHMHRQNLTHEADKTALAQSVNELLQANVNLRSKAIQDGAMFQNNMAEKDAQIRDLTQKLATAEAALAAKK